MFDDSAMDELNRRLYALPKAIRQDVRRRVFETTVPGVANPDGRGFVELIPDPAAARLRLRVALDELGRAHAP